MIQTEIVDGKTYAKVTDLKEWDRNPRGIKDEDFARLKDQLNELGQYKPLLVMTDGTVLGGNMRLKVYKSTGVEKVWVSIIQPKDEKEKLKFALSDNDNVGYYIEDKLLAIIKEVNFTEQDMQMLKVDLAIPVPLPKLLAKAVEQIKNQEVNIATMSKEFNCQCPKCGFQFQFEFEKTKE